MISVVNHFRDLKHVRRRDLRSLAVMKVFKHMNMIYHILYMNRNFNDYCTLISHMFEYEHVAAGNILMTQSLGRQTVYEEAYRGNYTGEDTGQPFPIVSTQDEQWKEKSILFTQTCRELSQLANPNLNCYLDHIDRLRERVSRFFYGESYALSGGRTASFPVGGNFPETLEIFRRGTQQDRDKLWSEMASLIQELVQVMSLGNLRGLLLNHWLNLHYTILSRDDNMAKNAFWDSVFQNLRCEELFHIMADVARTKAALSEEVNRIASCWRMQQEKIVAAAMMSHPRLRPNDNDIDPYLLEANILKHLLDFSPN